MLSQLRSWHSLSDEVFYHLSIWEVLPHSLNRGFSFKSAGVEEWPICFLCTVGQVGAGESCWGGSCRGRSSFALLTAPVCLGAAVSAACLGVGRQQRRGGEDRGGGGGDGFRAIFCSQQNTQAALPALVLPLLLQDGGAAQCWGVGQQARASIGDGHEGLGRSHGGELLCLARLLAGALLQHFDHGILLDDLSMQGLNPSLHVETSPVGQQDLLLLLLDASFQWGVIAGVGWVADHCGVPGNKQHSTWRTC